MICPIDEVGLGAAGGAGIGLGVEASVQRIFVFCLAGGAHGEDAHGGLVAIVGDVLDDREAGATVGAVDKGIMITSICGIKEFAKAVVAGGGIRRDERVALGASLAMGNDEGGLVTWLYRLDDERIDACQGRRLLAQGTLEAIERIRRSLDLDGYAGAVVEHEADQVPVQGLSIDERPEAYALDNALDDDASSLNFRTYY